MDEAAHDTHRIDSMPAELMNVRKIMQLEIEKQALGKESDEARIKLRTSRELLN